MEWVVGEIRMYVRCNQEGKKARRTWSWRKNNAFQTEVWGVKCNVWVKCRPSYFGTLLAKISSGQGLFSCPNHATHFFPTDLNCYQLLSFLVTSQTPSFHPKHVMSQNVGFGFWTGKPLNDFILETGASGLAWDGDGHRRQVKIHLHIKYTVKENQNLHRMCSFIFMPRTASSDLWLLPFLKSRLYESANCQPTLSCLLFENIDKKSIGGKYKNMSHKYKRVIKKCLYNFNR